ncbi:hypothetical protein TNCV_4134351 [Trichonephila clavipes]|nr:hypothetical protein TNCV_4134351 [Trichonephila clavipes]
MPPSYTAAYHDVCNDDEESRQGEYVLDSQQQIENFCFLLENVPLKGQIKGLEWAFDNSLAQILKRYRTLNCNKTTMYYSIDTNFFYSKDNLVALHFKYDQARRSFVEWAQNEIAVVPDFHKRILFSDEAHFWLNGYVNKQNCRIWSEANPQVYVKTPLHPEKLTVWCALWAGGILLQKRWPQRYSQW